MSDIARTFHRDFWPFYGGIKRLGRFQLPYGICSKKWGIRERDTKSPCSNKVLWYLFEIDSKHI